MCHTIPCKEMCAFQWCLNEKLTWAINYLVYWNSCLENQFEGYLLGWKHPRMAKIDMDLVLFSGWNSILNNGNDYNHSWGCGFRELWNGQVLHTCISFHLSVWASYNIQMCHNNTSWVLQFVNKTKSLFIITIVIT